MYYLGLCKDTFSKTTKSTNDAYLHLRHRLLMTFLKFSLAYFTFVVQCLRHALVVNVRLSWLHVQIRCMCLLPIFFSLPGFVFVVQISCPDKYGRAEAIRMRPNLCNKNKVPQNKGSAKSILYIVISATNKMQQNLFY